MRKQAFILVVVSWLLAGCARKSPNEPSVRSPDQGASEEATPTKQTSGSPACKRAGCSGELCVAADSDQLVTACEWKPHFACYDDAECAVQEDGRCGWTDTEQLRTCLETASKSRHEIRPSR